MDSFDKDSLNAIGRDGETDTAKRGRDSLYLAAQARIAGTPAVDVRVRNLSEGGLMVELERAVPAGTAIDINVRGIGWVTGKIAWFAEGRAGVAFDSPIDPKLARKPVGAGKTTPYYAKATTSRLK